MSIHDLTREQRVELKEALLVARNETASWCDLADADALISDAELDAEYEGVDFTSDDFYI